MQTLNQKCSFCQGYLPNSLYRQQPKIRLSEIVTYMYTVPKVIDFPRYDMKCSRENEMQYIVFLYFLCGSSDYFLDSVKIKWKYTFSPVFLIFYAKGVGYCGLWDCGVQGKSFLLHTFAYIYCYSVSSLLAFLFIHFSQ